MFADVHLKLASCDYMLPFSFLSHLTCLFNELCWHVNVVRHLSLQSPLPCEAASWCYLLGEKCRDQHSNQFLPVVTYRKGLLTTCCWLLSLHLFFTVASLQGQKKNTDVCDSPWFDLVSAASCLLICFIWSFFSSLSFKSVSVSVSLSLPLTISIMLFTDVEYINHLNGAWGPVCSLRLSFVQNVCCSDCCFLVCLIKMLQLYPNLFSFALSLSL